MACSRATSDRTRRSITGICRRNCSAATPDGCRRETAHRFADYAQIVAERLGDRVVSFATHNEPWVTAVLGHERGVFAPGVRDRRVAYQVGHHVLVSHALAHAGDSRDPQHARRRASC